ncbi:MAG TPA: hypothetical protein VNO43_09030 [Candidatus Eisenbacteria bacterium]|nr:hypothetical protein [Candidatus Eisenbacteria bacterium]
MPEQITKYPDVTLQVLEAQGAICGKGAPQQILTKCPADRFCSLKTGEICVYGINEIPKMTQVKTQELASVVCPKVQQGSLFGADGLLLAGVFLAGLALGGTRRSRRPAGAG